MPQKRVILFLALCSFITSRTASAYFAEVFAKASASKSYNSREAFNIDISGSTGLAILLIPQLRIEGRYTIRRHHENQIPALGVTDLISQSNIYSVSLDWDIVSDKNAVQPFILVGAGYLESSRTYWVDDVKIQDDKLKGIAVNAGAGFRIRIARALAIEIEAFAYARDPHKPNPLIDIYGNAGVRIFL